MSTQPIEKSIVLYKNHPAIVVNIGDKMKIQLKNGETKLVRNKDIKLIHKGPIKNFTELDSNEGELKEAWELLQGQTTNISELAELVYGENTPSSAWSAWLLVSDGLYFHGVPDKILIRTETELNNEIEKRNKKKIQKQEKEEFIERVRCGKILPEDSDNLKEIEALAYGLKPDCSIFKELKYKNTPENAHALLIKLGHWAENYNPYPRRYEVYPHCPSIKLPQIPKNHRQDLTHLESYAIDDEGNKDPDDAISFEDNKIWVHMADVAAMAEANGPLDQEALLRASNLYLPEKIITMLPEEVTTILGLGLSEISPALSIAIGVNPNGDLRCEEITPSLVKVKRITYKEANEKIDDEPFKSLYNVALKFKSWRLDQGGVNINLPEVQIRVQDEQVTISPLVQMKSRDMVSECMLMAGLAAARYAEEHNLPFPYTTQVAPDPVEKPSEMAGMYAYRKKMKPSEIKVSPKAHAGLGLKLYTRVTSPLRRYLDLVAHQQLRNHLMGKAILGPDEILERVGKSEAILSNLRKAERFSNKHWTLVHLSKNPHWKGQAILVGKKGNTGTAIIPELGLETKIQLNRQAELNEEITLSLVRTNIPELMAQFRMQ